MSDLEYRLFNALDELKGASELILKTHGQVTENYNELHRAMALIRGVAGRLHKASEDKTK